MVAYKGSTVMEASILCYKFIRIKVWQFSYRVNSPCSVRRTCVTMETYSEEIRAT